MADKLVMGRQVDSLAAIDKFGGSEANVAWPHFFQDVENALKFEMGNVGNMILNNKFPVNSVQRGERVDQEPGLIKMLLSTNRSLITFKSAWTETKEINGDNVDVITSEGEMNLLAALEKVKSSIFSSISTHGLVEGTAVKKDFDCLRPTYSENTLYEWIQDMKTVYGVQNKELLEAYINQLTQLRVIPNIANADIVRNILAREHDDGAGSASAGGVDLEEEVEDVVVDADGDADADADVDKDVVVDMDAKNVPTRRSR